jgi:hypothetical protein
MLKSYFVEVWKTGFIGADLKLSFDSKGWAQISSPMRQVLVAISLVRKYHSALSRIFALAPPERTVLDILFHPAFYFRGKQDWIHDDLRIWTKILCSSWLHGPIPFSSDMGIPNLITIILRESLVAAENSQSFDPLSFEPFMQAVKARGIKPNINFVQHMFDQYGRSSEVNFDRLSILFSYFPPRSLKAADPKDITLARPDCLLRIAARSKEATPAQRLNFIRLLLDSGLNPNWICKDYKQYSGSAWENAQGEVWGRRGKETALHAAAERGDIEIVKLLLERGTKKNLVDGWDQTAETRAENAAQMEVVKLLQGWIKPSNWFFRLLGL